MREPKLIEIPEAPKYRKTQEGYKVTHSELSKPITIRKGTEEEKAILEKQLREDIPGEHVPSQYAASLRTGEILTFEGKMPSDAHLHEISHFMVDKSYDFWVSEFAATLRSLKMARAPTNIRKIRAYLDNLIRHADREIGEFERQSAYDEGAEIAGWKMWDKRNVEMLEYDL